MLTARRRVAWWVAAIAVCMLVVAAELIARATGIGARCPDLYVARPLWACDPILGLKIGPDLAPAGAPLNHAGFRTHEFTAKRAGSYRVLALGDSCTLGMGAFGGFSWIAEPYPQRLERLAGVALGEGRVEVLNAGQAGYTSWHGVMLLRGKLRHLAPDLVTVRYGWNDHFAARPYEMYRESEAAITRAVEDLVLPLALYGVARRIPLDVVAWFDPHPTIWFPTAWHPTVPLDRYRRNLSRIVEIGRARGAAVWLLTSPHAFLIDAIRGRYDAVAANMSGTFLLPMNALPSFDRLIEIHESYNAATREVAAALGVPVVDLDAAYREHAAEPLFSLEDVVHPLQAGHDLEADVLWERARDVVASGR